MTGERTRYGIIGGGIAGLTVALEAARRGYETHVFEAAPVLGGLASSFEFHGAWIDRYYHFICGSDHDIVELARELGIEADIRWRGSRTYQYAGGHLYPFNGAADLLRFDVVPLLSRLRFGLHAAACRFITDWRSMEDRTGADWLRAWLGRKGFEAVWEPLLRLKFGHHAGRISAPWMWNRIHRLSSSRKHLWSKEQLGYLDGGSKPMFDALERRLQQLGVHIHLATRVDSVTIESGRVTGLTTGARHHSFDRVLAAAPPPVVAGLLPAGHEVLQQSLNRIEYVGVVCVMLLLERPLTDGFWININDSRVPMSGFIEYTNLDPMPALGGRSLVYVPYYVPIEDPLWTRADQPLFDETVRGLAQVLPGFAPSTVVDYRVFRDRFGQPICGTGFSQLAPKVSTGIEGLSIIDSTQLYPADRSRSGMIGLVREHLATLFG